MNHLSTKLYNNRWEANEGSCMGEFPGKRPGSLLRCASFCV